METLTRKQLIDLLVFFDNGEADFKQKLTASPLPLRRLYRLESNPNNSITTASEVYQYAFEVEEGYRKDKLSTLRRQLRETLVYFVKARMLDESALGQTLMADFLKQRGYHDEAETANRQSLCIAKKEPEQKRWLATFKAHESLHFSGKRGHLEKAMRNLLLFFLVSFLKLTIEQLTILRIADKQSPISEVLVREIAQVFKLLPTLKPPIIDIQVKSVEYFIGQNVESYMAFKSVFSHQTKSIGSDRKFLLNSLLNAITLFPKPNDKILQEYLPIYRFGIENTLFNEDGNLEIKTVCNILSTADFLEDYVLIELVKNKLIPLLPHEQEREWCKTLAKIYIFYGEGQYEKALDEIKKLDRESCTCFDITFRKNILRLKCSYEVALSRADAYDKVGPTKRNFEKLLERNYKNKNIDLLTKVRCSNFAKFLLKVCNPKTNKYTKAYLLEILANYKNKEEITESKWLKEKIAERSY